MSELEDFGCRMWFLNTPCRFKARSSGRLERHQREIHEPEALAANGYSPGFEEPFLTHVNIVRKSGRTARTTERIDKVYRIGDWTR